MADFHDATSATPRTTAAAGAVRFGWARSWRGSPQGDLHRPSTGGGVESYKGRILRRPPRPSIRESESVDGTVAGPPDWWPGSPTGR